MRQDPLAALGNLTSQLFINIYLDTLDKFVKERLGIKNYIRCADDFLVICQSKEECEAIARSVRQFVERKLRLRFPKTHERIAKLSGGVEILGLRFLPFYRVIRPKTRKRMLEIFKDQCEKFTEGEIGAEKINASWQSLRGLLKYGSSYYISERLLSMFNYHAQRNTKTI